jgi:hypothetical protein
MAGSLNEATIVAPKRRERKASPHLVLAGLDPAIHVFLLGK